MKIVIVGAGALGGLVGAQLTESGEDVTFLEIDPARAALLNEKGLLISQDDQPDKHVAIKVVTSVEELQPADLIFISVKSYQTEKATSGLAPIIGPQTRVLSAGIKPIQISSFQGKSTEVVQKIGEVFIKAGLKTDVVENIDHVIWQKLLHNAVVNPVAALSGLNCNQLLEDEDLQQLMRALCEEIVAVMRARGVPIVDEEDPYRPVIGSQKALGPNQPSMWQDLSRGLRTEIDALNGAIVDEAKRHSLSAPCNFTIVRLIHSAERKKNNGR
ncbi:MAG: NAD(P)-binding domain-containing protein [Deltaproteobacteria bacterium]|nr:NAD(P)-binding domain-containing protein [Deltaproteobacteria bacterium]